MLCALYFLECLGILSIACSNRVIPIKYINQEVTRVMKDIVPASYPLGLAFFWLCLEKG